MTDSSPRTTWLDRVTHRFGLASVSERSLVIERKGWRVEIPADVPAGELELVDRHHYFALLYGVRLGLDRRISDYDFGDERPSADDKARNAYEIRSMYGERLQRLVPALTLSVAERIGDFEAFAQEWVDPGLAVVNVVESGRCLHTFAENDFDEVDFDRENAAEYARYALFYASYKTRPVDRMKSTEGKIRVFESTEGLTSSRAILLPDFDYDAAREDGFAAILDRDVLVIGEPAGAPARDAFRSTFENTVAPRLQHAELPFSSIIFHLDASRIRGGDVIGETRFPLPAGDSPFDVEAIEVERVDNGG